eukprot:gene24935-45773_t
MPPRAPRQSGALSKVRLCGDPSNRTVYGFFEYVERDGAE